LYNIPNFIDFLRLSEILKLWFDYGRKRGGKVMEYSGLIINIIITVFLAMDASKHNKRPVLWGILGFLLGPIALGIYLIQTNRKVLGWIITIVAGIGYLAFIALVVLAALFVTAM
jgi:hypothetical protein